MRAPFAIPVCLLLAACTGREAPARVTLEARPLSREAARGESVAAVESGRSTVAVRRTIALTAPCRVLAAGVARAGGELTLLVVAEPDGRACPRREVYLAYTARIDRLPPGRYDLRVVHVERGGRGGAAPGAGDAVLVMERSVEVS
ncbi:MAG TPA: hypothetical protein VHG91_12770 [Longimicrobium sp.]|nr:hypothetical protein [Longimicrobium sp.]